MQDSFHFNIIEKKGASYFFLFFQVWGRTVLFFIVMLGT